MAAFLAEARGYLAHLILGPRPIECTELVNQVQGGTVHAIFGNPDDLKFRSCMTLYGNIIVTPDPLTLGLLQDAP